MHCDEDQARCRSVEDLGKVCGISPRAEPREREVGPRHGPGPHIDRHDHGSPETALHLQPDFALAHRGLAALTPA